MALIHPWLGLLLLVLCAAAVLIALRLRLPDLDQTDPDALPMANTERLRALPRFQALARRQWWWRVLEAACLGATALGVILLVARPVTTTLAPQDRHNRDIVLCLDVSGSMRPVNRFVIDAYLELARSLEGERIGFVMFDSSAVTVFPLTDDAPFIQEHLQRAREELTGNAAVPGTTVGQGSSLIGDGLASCLQRFDRTDPGRSRTVVFATDNLLAGTPILTLGQAATRAVDWRILAFGIVPGTNSVSATVDLTNHLRRTGGDTLLLTPQRATDVGVIERAVQATEEAAIAARPEAHAADLLLPGVVLALLGMAGATYVWARRSRP